MHNIDSDTLVLGKYKPTIEDGVPNWSKSVPESYNIVAKNNNATYFDLGSEYDAIKVRYNITDNDMLYLLNLPALTDAISSNKTIKFTVAPRDFETGAIV